MSFSLLGMSEQYVVISAARISLQKSDACVALNASKTWKDCWFSSGVASCEGNENIPSMHYKCCNVDYVTTCVLLLYLVLSFYPTHACILLITKRYTRTFKVYTSYMETYYNFSIRLTCMYIYILTYMQTQISICLTCICIQ